MLNLLWLLLPVAAAAGWFAATRSAAARPDAFWNTSANFHAGLNKLLNDSGDLPGELFDSLSDTDKDTADTHLALGNLYRRRGDVNRAILLHESLLDKPELGEPVHSAALLALAKDYDSAGLLDRAEKTLTTLIDLGQRLPDGYAAMLTLHERERAWDRAIETANEIERVAGDDRSSLIAHYYCELALEASAAGYADQALILTNDALARCDRSARAHMMLAKFASDEGDSALALKHYASVENFRPELMPEIIDDWFDELLNNGDQTMLREFIDHIRHRRNAYSVVRTTRSIIEELDDVETANRFFKDQILQRPSLKGLRDWAQDQIAVSKPGEREKVQVICAMLDKVVEDKPTYQCGSCGFLGNQLHWHCPSCKTWDSVQPIIGAEGE